MTNAKSFVLEYLAFILFRFLVPVPLRVQPRAAANVGQSQNGKAIHPPLRSIIDSTGHAG
jgi:hypothetical protein